ncbi:hypothetical protein TRAPUB_2537 [Trametes pubescens]|uniref:Uncharacterized protein n=1 Tax=Trametes pubescens TaxID=154538 RepID=A0A1M2VG83_TRAPU|nr:hypothetical protein TRAPUB_2537 [Trametes pubescens]
MGAAAAAGAAEPSARLPNLPPPEIPTPDSRGRTPRRAPLGLHCARKAPSLHVAKERFVHTQATPPNQIFVRRPLFPIARNFHDNFFASCGGAPLGAPTYDICTYGIGGARLFPAVAAPPARHAGPSIEQALCGGQGFIGWSDGGGAVRVSFNPRPGPEFRAVALSATARASQ